MESVTGKIKTPSTIELANSTSYAGEFLTKITPKDKKLLQKAVTKFRPHSKNYEDSWGYVIQATRYGGFKWYDKEKHYIIFFGRKSDVDETIVVPLFFAPPDYLEQVMDKVRKLFKVQKIILKNVSRPELKGLTRSGFRQYRQDEFWAKDARFDDQTYPQQVVDLRRLFEINGPTYHHLRQTLNKKPDVYLRSYRAEDREAVFEIFALRDGNTKEFVGKEHGMYYASHAMYPDSEIDKYVVVDSKTHEVLGFVGASDISPEYTALVASIFKPAVRIASVWAIYQVLIQKYKQGFRFANLGGCETEGTYTFLKRKFRPVKKIKSTTWFLTGPHNGKYFQLSI